MASHQADILPHNDASAQQSQQAPQVQLLNSTRASERWDGKSKLEKLLEPIVNGIRSYLDPIANVFYAMPATFRGLNSDVTTMKTIEEEKKTREILVPQPRFIAQRKMNYRKAYRPRPKKYTELNLDLDKLKKNKDLYDYLKTKKYKFNYQNTYYYPRVKYFVNPNSFFVKPKNTRLVPYIKEIIHNASTPKPNVTSVNLGYWKPVILLPILTNQSGLHNSSKTDHMYVNVDNMRHKRAKRSLGDVHEDGLSETEDIKHSDLSISGRSVITFMQALTNQVPVKAMWKDANIYTKNMLKHSLKSVGPPAFYSITYDIIMITLDIMDGLIEVQQDLTQHFFGGKSKKHKTSISSSHPPKQKPSKKKKKKKKPHTHHHHQQQQELQQLQQQQQQQNIRDEDDELDFLGKKAKNI